MKKYIEVTKSCSGFRVAGYFLFVNTSGGSCQKVYMEFHVDLKVFKSVLPSALESKNAVSAYFCFAL